MDERSGEDLYLHHAQVRNRQQSAVETISQLPDDIERLARVAFQSSKEVQVHTVPTTACIGAVSSLEVQDAVRLARTQSLRAAHTCGFDVEAAPHTFRFTPLRLYSQPRTPAMRTQPTRALLAFWNCNEPGYMREKRPENDLRKSTWNPTTQMPGRITSTRVLTSCMTFI